MKKIKQILTILILVLTFASCSSVKVTDAWKADDINTLKTEKILVIARTDDMVSRQRFEQEITAKLKAAGVDAVESYSKFPAIQHNKERTPEEVAEIEQILKNEGFNGVVLTVLKDKSKEIVTSQTGGYTTGGYYPSAYGGYYGGFGGYYGAIYSPYGYGYGGAYVPAETRTYTSETYLLETVVYDLRKEMGKQLVAVVSVDITDPPSASKVAPEYANAVAKQFNLK